MVQSDLGEVCWRGMGLECRGMGITVGWACYVAVDNSKAFEEAVFPPTVMQLRSFIGAANVYRRFVEKYSEIPRPLNSMLRKDEEPDWDDPTDTQMEAFETLKERLISPPILARPKAGRPYMIDTDASAYQLGATLLQQQDEEKPNDWASIKYWSKTLSDTERNYSTTERECYSVVWSVTTLRPHIEGLSFTVRTDHDALRWLMTVSDSIGRFMRWRIRLSEYDFTVKYRPGLVHQVPDALSRVLTPDGNDNKPIDDEVPTYGDHESVLVTTRRKAANSSAAQKTHAKETNERKQRKRGTNDTRKNKTTKAADISDEEQWITEFERNHDKKYD